MSEPIIPEGKTGHQTYTIATYKDLCIRPAAGGFLTKTLEISNFGELVLILFLCKLIGSGFYEFSGLQPARFSHQPLDLHMLSKARHWPACLPPGL